MYNNYKLVTFMLNVEGGASETVEHFDVTESEAILKVYDKLSSVGGNPATKSIKVMLFNPNGGLIKTEELVKAE